MATSASASPGGSQAHGEELRQRAVEAHCRRARKHVMDAIEHDESQHPELARPLWARALNHLDAAMAQGDSTTLKMVQVQGLAEKVRLRLDEIDNVSAVQPPTQPPPPYSPTSPVQSGQGSQRPAAPADSAVAADAPYSYRFGDLTRSLYRAAVTIVAEDKPPAPAARATPSTPVQPQSQPQPPGPAPTLRETWQAMLERVTELIAPTKPAAGTAEPAGQAVFLLRDGASLFDIYRETRTSSPRHVNASVSCIVVPSVTQPSQTLRCLQCEDWIFPLVQGSPCLRVRHRFYIFPSGAEAESALPEITDGSSSSSNGPVRAQWVGLLLNERVSDAQVRSFEGLLSLCDLQTVQNERDDEYNGLVVYEECAAPLAISDGAHNTSGNPPLSPVFFDESFDSDDEDDGRSHQSLVHVHDGTDSTTLATAAKPTWGDNTAGYVKGGLTLVAHGVVRGAELTASVVSAGGERLRQHLTPTDQPVQVNPRLQSGVRVAGEVSSSVYHVTKYLVERASYLADQVVARTVPVVVDSRIGQYVRHHCAGGSGSGHAAQAGKVVLATIHGALEVSESLIDSAKILATELAEETNTTVGHKYGENVEDLSRQSLTALGNASSSVLHVRSLGYKKLLKKTARKTVVQAAQETLGDSCEEESGEEESDEESGKQLELEDKQLELEDKQPAAAAAIEDKSPSE